MSAAARAWLGDQAGAFADAGEATELGEHLGYAADTAVALEMLAWQSAARGRHDDARVALERAVALTDRAETTTVHAHHAITAAFCALSRHEPAEAAALLEQRIAADGGIGSMGEPLGVAPPLIEAYAALGRTADAAALARRYVRRRHNRSPAHDRALVERSLALAVADDDTAVAAYERALVAHEQDTSRFEAARTRLLYGERLRRAGRRVNARVQLRAALDEFTAADLLAWADRAAQELDATGATARSRGPVREEPLTSQETRVALLVAKGQSNKEVAAALFLSPKTVEHHLGSVFRKRGYRSRAELAAPMARSAPPRLTQLPGISPHRSDKDDLDVGRPVALQRQLDPDADHEAGGHDVRAVGGDLERARAGRSAAGGRGPPARGSSRPRSSRGRARPP